MTPSTMTSDLHRHKPVRKISTLATSANRLLLPATLHATSLHEARPGGATLPVEKQCLLLTSGNRSFASKHRSPPPTNPRLSVESGIDGVR